MNGHMTPCASNRHVCSMFHNHRRAQKQSSVPYERARCPFALSKEVTKSLMITTARLPHIAQKRTPKMEASELGFLKAQCMGQQHSLPALNHHVPANALTANINTYLLLYPNITKSDIRIIISGAGETMNNPALRDWFIARVISTTNLNPGGGAGLAAYQLANVLAGQAMPTVTAALEDLVRESGNFVVKSVSGPTNWGAGGKLPGRLCEG